MPRSHQEVESLLIKLEDKMRLSYEWSATELPGEFLNSAMPFAFDKMTFPQWLQFIFIPKMQEIIQHRQALPMNMGLLPMAVHSLGRSANKQPMLDVIEQIDNLFEQ